MATITERNKKQLQIFFKQKKKKKKKVKRE